MEHMWHKKHIEHVWHIWHKKHIQEDFFNWAMGMGITRRPSDPPPLNFFRLLVGRWGSFNIFTYRPTLQGGGVSVKKNYPVDK